MVDRQIYHDDLDMDVQCGLSFTLSVKRLSAPTALKLVSHGRSGNECRFIMLHLTAQIKWTQTTGEVVTELLVLPRPPIWIMETGIRPELIQSKFHAEALSCTKHVKLFET